MFSTEITKVEHATSTFEVKFTNLSFVSDSDRKTYRVKDSPIFEDDIANTTASISRYQLTKNQGYSFWNTIDPINGEEKLKGPQTLTVIPTTFTIVTIDQSPISIEPMIFTVTFHDNGCKVLQVLPIMQHIKLEYTITLTTKYFCFENADPQAIEEVKLATHAKWNLEEAEAFKVGIFMLALGSMGLRIGKSAHIAALVKQERHQREEYLERLIRSRATSGVATMSVDDSDDGSIPGLDDDLDIDWDDEASSDLPFGLADDEKMAGQDDLDPGLARVISSFKEAISQSSTSPLSTSQSTNFQPSTFDTLTLSPFLTQHDESREMT